MADKPSRQVHFDENPVSDLLVFQSPPRRPKPNIVLRTTPPRVRFPPATEATFTASLNRGTLEGGFAQAHRFPSHSNSGSHRDGILPGSHSHSIDDDIYDQEEWSQERESDEIEDSRASQTKNAIQHFLYSHGDVPQSLDTTKRVLDELLTDFITEICFEASRSAQLSGRQKIKIDDIRFACRKSPVYLGKIQEIQEKKEEIDKARKTLDVNDDKITRSNVKALEEPPLGDADDDMEVDTQISRGKGR